MLTFQLVSLEKKRKALMLGNEDMNQPSTIETYLVTSLISFFYLFKFSLQMLIFMVIITLLYFFEATMTKILAKTLYL
jgi:hypothetical protein